MRYLFVVLFTLNVNVYSQGIKVLDILSRSGELIYSKANTSEPDEYIEGNLYIKNFESNNDKLLFKDILVDHVVVKWISKDKILVFTLAKILILDRSGNILQTFEFNENESVKGVEYNKESGVAIFLLAIKDSIGSEKITLCSFDVQNLKLTTVIDSLLLDHRHIENLFYKLFLVKENCLLVHNTLGGFLLINLLNKQTTTLQLEFKSSFNDNLLFDVSSNGIQYIQYINKEKSKYEILEYSFATGKSNQYLVGNNKFDKKVNTNIFSSPYNKDFVVQIDKDICFYNYQEFIKISLENFEQGLKFDGFYFYYLQHNNTIKRKKV